MILNSIELHNIRSYNDEKIEFPRGITLFEGDIGSGKSTVLMAVEFALFGLGSQKPDGLLNKKETEGHVILNFEVNGKRYEIKRKLKRKGNSISQESKSCYLISDGEKEPFAASELKQKILQILKFNEPSNPTSGSKIYRYAVFTPQEEMKQILRDSERRLETIRKAFGMEDYKIAVENAKTMISTLRTKIAVFKERSSDIDEQKKSLDKTTKEEFNESREILCIMKELATLEKKKLETRNVVDEARKKQKEKDKLELQKDNVEKDIRKNKLLVDSILERIDGKKQEIHDVKERITNLKKIIKPTDKNLSQIDKEIEKIEELNNKVTDINSKIESSAEDLSRLSRRIGTYSDSRTEELQNQVVEIKNLIVELTKKYDEVNNLIIEKEKSNARLEERKQDLESKLQGVTNFGSKCPYCENLLTKEHIKNLEKERRQNLQEIEDNIQQIQSEISENSNKKNDLNEQISKNESIVSKIEPIIPLLQQRDEKNGQLYQLQLKIKELGDNKIIPEEKSFPNNGKFKEPLSYMKSLRDALIQFENAEQQIEQEKNRKTITENDLERIEKEKKSLEQEVSGLEEKLENMLTNLKPLKNIDNILSKAEDDEESVRDNIDGLKENLSTKKERVKNLKEEIERINGEISEAKKAQEKYEKFINCQDWLKDFLIPTLEQIEKQVLLSIQHNFNGIYQNWFSVLIDDPTKNSRIDEEFSPIIEQDGYEQDVEYLSGGEKTSIALAYRLTLNSMMRQETESLKSNLLILDEPTDGFSKTQLSKVRTVLQQLQSQQIILVSHEKELETYVENIFYVSKDSGISHVHRRNN